MRSPNYKHWTRKEEKFLIKASVAGVQPKFIAAVLGRTIDSVYGRCHREDVQLEIMRGQTALAKQYEQEYLNEDTNS